MAKPNAYLEFLLEALQPLGAITARAMFGGHGLYCDGIFFALVGRNALFLKADDVNRPDFEQLGLKPFRPFPDRTEVMQYYEAPAEIFEDADALHRWAGGSVKAGLRGKSKPKPAARKTRQPRS